MQLEDAIIHIKLITIIIILCVYLTQDRLLGTCCRFHYRHYSASMDSQVVGLRSFTFLVRNRLSIIIIIHSN